MTESEPATRPTYTIEVFLAHALLLENEAVDVYRTIGESMAVHNNLDVAALFLQMAGYGRKHADEVKTLAEGLELPCIAPCDFTWQNGASPEMPAMDKVHYMMQPAQALALALRAERQAQAFYASVAASSPVARVRELASEFAAEEAEHVRLLTEWITNDSPPDRSWGFDPESPASPDER